jgi:SAM-dependent methyltransferase
MNLGAYLYGELIKRGADLKAYAPLFQAEIEFHSWHYLRHTARRLEHLASLCLPLKNRSVLELGAGIGDHSNFFLDRGCKVTITEPRAENLTYMKARFPEGDVRHLDLEMDDPLGDACYDVIYAYGVLYHVSNPAATLAFFDRHCAELLLLETCVSFGQEEEINPTPEEKMSFTQSSIGQGCRPTRPWLFTRLKKNFEYVYLPLTQPNHEEFPLDWTAPEQHIGLSRSIFIASRYPIENDNLTTQLVLHQERQP